jgi:hypothetical protein
MTQIGEPVGPSVPPQSGEPKILLAEIVQVVFESPIKVAVAKATVQEPHWKTGLDVEESTWKVGKKNFSGRYSKRPAVYLCKSSGGSRVATVTVKVNESTVSGNGKLTGILGSLRFEGDCPLSVGEHVVVAEIKEVPDDFTCFMGNIVWRLAGSEASAALNSTRAELFFIYDTPHRAYKNGVWIEALRFLNSVVLLHGTHKKSDAITKVVRYCHGPKHGLKYDSAGGGRSRYGVTGTGGTLKLSLYLERALPTANCYDQAAAVQALCGAAGIIVEWIYLDPFGFIKPTNLLGYGLCNSPFFLSKVPPGNKLMGSNDRERSAFGNHAFCRWSAKILDACAGPHLGTESANEYVDSSIDSQTSLYQLYQSFRPGKAADMVLCPGLAGVS